MSVILVAGASGSGKTKYAQLLQFWRGGVVFHTDAYYKVPRVIGEAKAPIDFEDVASCDLMGLLSDVMSFLRTDQLPPLRMYQMEGNRNELVPSYSAHPDRAPSHRAIVEGIFAHHLAEYIFPFDIFVMMPHKDQCALCGKQYPSHAGENAAPTLAVVQWLKARRHDFAIKSLCVEEPELRYHSIKK
jgi:uridine kinase